MLPVRQCDLYHPHAGLAAEAVVSGHEKYDGVRRSMAALTNRFNRKRQTFAAVERKLLEAEHAPTVLCLSEYVKSHRAPTLFAPGIQAGDTFQRR